MSSYSIGSIFPPFPPSAKGVCRGRPWTNSFIGGADDMDGMGRFITRTEMPHSHATLYGGMGNFGKATCVSCKSTVFNEWFDEYGYDVYLRAGPVLRIGHQRTDRCRGVWKLEAGRCRAWGDRDPPMSTGRFWPCP